ncbi:hypothetical protein NF699_06415 [Sphingomonadaceae bacterium OTU29LAMAA1]|nr:hypothetical protein NF699_06415 [Sphingomonadaceae bacterium OTU29LAMAA1]
MSTTEKKIIATRDFTDAGIGKQFKQGEDVTAEPGKANYIAAGCAAEPDAEKADVAASGNKTQGGKPA